MVTFFCRCGHNFGVNDEIASTVVRCPNCNAIIESPPIDNKKSSDADFEESYELAEPDPVPIPVKTITVADPLPVESVVVLNYQPKSEAPSLLTEPVKRLKKDMTRLMDWTIVDQPPAENLTDIFRALNKPITLLPMICLLLTHLAVAIVLWATLEAIFFVSPAILLLAFALFAYFVNVLDEIAVEERDELPRFGRDLRFREDYLNPCVIMITALLVCFAPAVALIFTDLPISGIVTAGVMLCLIGAYPFPAILLTLTASGSIANMRPDRVRGVVHVSGRKYLISVLLFIGGAVPYALGLIGFFFETLSMAEMHPRIPHWLLLPYISLPLAGTGLYLLHAFAWHLGMIYRLHSRQFPWVGRGGTRERPPIAVKQSRRKYVAPTEPLEM